MLTVIESDVLGLRIRDRLHYNIFARPTNNISQFKRGDKVKIGILNSKKRFQYPVLGIGKVDISEKGIYNEYWDLLNCNTITRRHDIDACIRIKNGMFLDTGSHVVGGFLQDNFVKTVHPITNISQRKSKMRVYGYSYRGVSVIHREDGPAVIYDNTQTVDSKINGYKFSLTRDFIMASGMSDEDAVLFLLKYGEKLPTKYMDSMDFI